MEAAEATWPNFKTFFGRFMNHPALGPGAVEDSSATPNVEPGPSAAAQTEHGEDATTPETSRPPSRAPIESVGDRDSASEEEEDIQMNPTRSKERVRHHLLPGLGRKREREQQRHSSCSRMQKCKSKPNSGKCNTKTKCKRMLWPFKLKWSKTG